MPGDAPAASIAACSTPNPSPPPSSPPRSPATIVAPADAGVGPRPPRLEPRRRPAPRARRAARRRRDVVAIVRHARANGLSVAPQGTGHDAARDRLARRHDPGLDAADARRRDRRRGADRARPGRARCGSRSPRPPTPHGLFPLSGSSPDVGVVGYTLGGGLSWLARKHGLAANSVTAIEVVTPDGELVRATADDHAELFWALRGGGGNFGVVTAMEFRLFPYGEVYAGHAPVARTSAHAEVLRAWRDWTRDGARRGHDVARGSCTSRRCPSCRRSCAAARSS